MALADNLYFICPLLCVSREKLLWGRKWLICGWGGGPEGGAHREIVSLGAAYCATLSLKRVKNSLSLSSCVVDSSWNVMAHGVAREGKWRGNWWMEWVTSTLHTTSERGVSSITTADTHTSAASRRAELTAPPPPGRFEWTSPFRRKTKSGFCACTVTFQTQSSLDTRIRLKIVRFI
jgi:hypothetical protein